MPVIDPRLVGNPINFSPSPSETPWSDQAASSWAGYKSGWSALNNQLFPSDENQLSYEALLRERDYWAARAQSGGIPQRFDDAEGVGGTLAWLGGQAVNSAPYFAEAALGGVAGRALGGAAGVARGAAGTAGAVLAGYPSAVGDVLNNQFEQKGYSDLPSAAALGVPYAALNAVGIEGALGRLGLPAASQASRLGRIAVGAGKVGLSEGVSETGQEVMNQLGRMQVDPQATLTSPDALERYRESFIAGAALGGAVGGGGKVFSSAPANLLPQANPPQAPATPPAAPPVQAGEPQGPMWQYELPLEGGSGGQPAPIDTVAQADLGDVQLRAQLDATARSRRVVEDYLQRGTRDVEERVNNGDVDGAVQLMRSLQPYKDALTQLRQQEAGLARRLTDANGLIAGRISGNPQQLGLFAPTSAANGQTQLPGTGNDVVPQDNPPRTATVPELGAPIKRPGSYPADITSALGIEQPTPQIALPTAPPAAAGVITPTRQTPMDQYLEAQRKQARGALLTGYEQELLRNPPQGPDVALASAAAPRAEFQLRGEPTPQFERSIETAPELELTSENQPSLFGESDLRDLARAPGIDKNQGKLELPHWKDGAREAYTKAGGRDYKGIASVLRESTPEKAAAVVRGKLEGGAKPDAWEALHKQLVGETASEWAGRQKGQPETAAPAPVETPAPKTEKKPAKGITFNRLSDTQFLTEGGSRELGVLQNKGKWWVVDTATGQPVGPGHPDLSAAQTAASKELTPKAERAPRGEESKLLADAIERMNTAKDNKAYLDALGYVYEVAQDNTKLGEKAKAALADVPAGDMEKAKKRYEMMQRTVERILKRNEDAPAGGMAAAAVREVVDIVSGHWAKLPKINVVQSRENLPVKIYAETSETTQALYHPLTQTMYIIADRVAGPREVAIAIAHEVLGHHGFRGIMADVYAEMRRLYLGNAELRQRADAKRAQYKENGSTLTNEEAMEEVLAEMAERGESPNLLDKIILLVQRAFRALGLDIGVTEAEAKQLVANARKYVMRGKGITGATSTTQVSVMQRVIPNTPQQAATSVVDWAKDRAFDSDTKLTEWGKYLRTNLQLERAYNKLLPSITPFVTLTRQMVAYANQRIAPVIEIERELGSREMAPHRMALAEIAFDSSLAEIDPSLDFEAQDHLAEDRRAEYERLRIRWNRLAKPAQDLYVRMRDYLQQNWELRGQLVAKNIKAHYDLLMDEARKHGNAEKVSQLTEELETESAKIKTLLRSKKGPYFPLMRFGRYVAVGKSADYMALENSLKGIEDEVYKLRMQGASAEAIKAANGSRTKAAEMLAKLKKDGAHYRVEAYERPADRERAAAQMETEGLLSHKLNSEEYMREVSGLHSGFLARIKEAADVSLPPEAASKVREVIHDLYAHSMPETSAMRRQLRREGVQGFNKDLTRVFTSTALRDAHHLSRLAYNDQLMDSLATMRNQAKGTTEAQDVYNQMANRFATSAKYMETPILDTLSNFNFIMYLGLSPAFILTNLMQTPMVTGPMLAARFGYTRGYGAIAQAMGNVAKSITTEVQKDWLRFQLHPDKMQGVSSDEREMLRKLFNDGVIDMMMEHDLAATAKGSTHWFGKFARRMSYFAHHTEITNRVVTALAAYRLATQGGNSDAVPAMKHDAAIAYAQRVIDDTHLDYSPENAPYFMRPAVFRPAKVLFQFKKYQQGMIWLLASNFKTAFLPSNATAQERAEARKFLFGVLAAQQLVTGALGLPMAFPIGVLAKVLAGIFGDPEDEFDPEIAFRQFMADMFGETGGQVLSKGLPALMDVDLRNIGMGEILNPMGRMNTGGKEGREYFKELVYGALGPLGGQLGDKFEAMRHFEQGDVLKGVELSVPKFIASPLKAYRYGSDGLTTRSGNTSLESDRFHAWDLTLQSLGFTPDQVSEHYAASAAKESASAARDDYHKLLLRRWSEARSKNDRSALKDANADIEAFNQRNPANRITESAKLRSAQQRKRYQQEKNRKGVRIAEYERDLEGLTDFAAVE